MNFSTRALKVGVLRGAILGGTLGLVAGPFGVAVGAIAGPMALLEARASAARRGSRAAALLWTVALLGCFLAYTQAVYAGAAMAQGPGAGIQALLAEVERIQGAEAQAFRLYLLCGALAFSGASVARLGGRARDFAWLGVLTGLTASFLAPLANSGTWPDQLAALVFVVPCLAAGALPFWVGLWMFYAAVDLGLDAWEARRGRGVPPLPEPALGAA